MGTSEFSRNRQRILYPLLLAALFPTIQMLTSAAAGLLLHALAPPAEAARMLDSPNSLLVTVGISQIIALFVIAQLGRPILMPATRSRIRDLRLLLALAIPVLVLTFGGQLVESGTLALLDIDMGRYRDIQEVILAADLVVVLVAVAVIPGICEELIFREIIQPATTYTLGAVAGIVYTSALFALVHLVPIQIVAAFAFGLLFGYLRYRTGSVYPAILAHIAANAMVAVYGRATADLPEAAPVTGIVVTTIAVGVAVVVAGIVLVERTVRRKC